MNLVLCPSRGGSPVCRADELYLHSPYAPEREAERFIERMLGDRAPTAIVLIAPCLDYLSPLLRARFPGATIAALQPDAFFRDKEMGGEDAIWYPDSALSLADFLDRAIDEDAVSGLAVLEWQPGVQAFPEAAARFREALRFSLDRLTGSAATIKAFGRRWVANACRSFLLVERIAAPFELSCPVVLAAAGPSLGASLAALAPYRRRFALLAVSSALAACRAAGMEPDLVVATDGGFWSRVHLYPLARRPALLAAPLTALPSAQLWRGLPLLLLDQRSFAESALLPALGEALGLPPHGTVAGSGLRLAARLSSGPIVAAGLDLAARGEQEHASPHAFDGILAAAEKRLAPRSSSSYARMLETAPLPTRSGAWRRSRSLASYAEALGCDAADYPGRLFRLDPSPVEIAGFAAVGDAELPGILGRVEAEIGQVPSRPAPELGARRATLRVILERWRREAQEGAAFLAAGRVPESPSLREMFRFLDLPDWAAARRASLSVGDPRPAARDLARWTERWLGELERSLLG